MAIKDEAGRDARITSMITMHNYQWLLLHTLHGAVSKHLGNKGLEALEKGFRRYGFYRGQHLRDLPESFSEGRDALSLLSHWDAAEFMVTSLGGPVTISGGPARATITLPCVPGSDYYKTHDGGDMLEPFWRNMLPGLAEGYGDGTGVEFGAIPAQSDTPWTVTWTYPGASEAPRETAFEDVFDDRLVSIQMNRRTFGVFAALQMYVGFQLTEDFPDNGEMVLKEALFEFGMARGRELRERAEAKGKPLNFTTWFEELQERDPGEAVFVFRGETVASPGVWEAECTYCPLAHVWAEEGHRGMAMGYIYDVENHRGLVKGFHPNGEVNWDTVKMRGDKTCKFQFWIPDLVTKEDPDWAQPENKLQGL